MRPIYGEAWDEFRREFHPQALTGWSYEIAQRAFFRGFNRGYKAAREENGRKKNTWKPRQGT